MKANNTFVSYIFILLGLFVLLIFARSAFSELQIQQDARESTKAELEKSSQKLESLNAVQKELSASGSDVASEIQGMSEKFVEADIVSYLHDYAKDVNTGSERIIFQSITFSEPSQSDFGFDKVTVTADVLVSNESTLFSFLDYLVDKEAQYRFYLPSFSYPFNEQSGNLQVSIPLDLYFKN